MADKKKTPPVVHLSYSKGELIIKEGDYGISIYKISKGHVRIFKKSNNTIVPLATLGRGEVFGEMTFFNFLLEPRSASVEAIDDVELEVWHPVRLAEEYKNMPAILRYITQQSLHRLLRMNRVIDELTAKKKKGKEEQLAAEKRDNKRRYYRKNCDQECSYHSATHSSKVTLRGVIKDISPMGVGMEVNARNAINVSLKPGNQLKISFQLPSGSSINEVAIIKSVKKSKVPGYLFLGLEYKDISKDALKQIGFFMMS
jgi:CRP/FNR family cyclic AMP-dependent transcriptional regulator